MMIKFFLLMTLAISLSAHANCIGEAQISGKIKEVKKGYTSCRAFLVDDARIQSSAECPLNKTKLQLEGIEVGLLNGHDCKMEVGDTISGVVVDNGYAIYLE